MSSISDRLAVMPSMLIASLSGKFSFLPRWKLFLVGLGFFYALSPLDFIPELFFGPFGLADDAAIVALCLSVLFRAADEFVSPGVIKGETIPGETVPRDAAAPAGEVISGEVISSKPA